MPTDECRQPQQTFAALRGLPWVTVSRRPEQQLETQAPGRAVAGCPRPHRQFAVLQARAYVEIGGCHRVLRPGNGIGQASPAALAVINRVGRG